LEVGEDEFVELGEEEVEEEQQDGEEAVESLQSGAAGVGLLWFWGGAIVVDGDFGFFLD
jgi:hypothetical protein